MMSSSVLVVATAALVAVLGYANKEDTPSLAGGPAPGIVMLQVASTDQRMMIQRPRHRPHQKADMIEQAHKAEEDDDSDSFRAWDDSREEKVDGDEQADISLVHGSRAYGAPEESLQQHKEKTPIAIGTCVTTQYGVALLLIGILVLGLAFALYLQTKTKAALITKVRGLRAKLRVDRARILQDEKKIRMDAAILKEDQRILIQAIHDRGNVFFDPELREIVLKREIPFDPVLKTDSASYAPRACFSDPQSAKLVLSDVSELLRILPSACLLIEGHTIAGSLDQLDEFAHEVADSRALVVKETLVLFGCPPYRLEALGLPGALGNNKAEVLLKLVN